MKLNELEIIISKLELTEKYHVISGRFSIAVYPTGRTKEINEVLCLGILNFAVNGGPQVDIKWSLFDERAASLKKQFVVKVLETVGSEITTEYGSCIGVTYYNMLMNQYFGENQDLSKN